MTLAALNDLPPGRAEAELKRVCGSAAWARAVAARRPFADPDALRAAADAAWDDLEAEDWREAFAGHPRIGAEPPSGEAGSWPRREQSSMAAASDAVRAALADAQRRYEHRFGHVFLISASGRTPEEMLAACEERLGHDPAGELEIAAAEERKIGRLRLERLLSEGGDE